MKRFIASILTDFLASFKVTDGGYSARKMSAFAAVLVSITITIYRFVPDSIMVEVLALWLMFAAVCMGLVTYAQLAEIKSGGFLKKETKKTEETITSEIK